MAAAGAAAAALVSTVDADSAGATTGTMVYGTFMDADVNGTVLRSAATPATLSVTNSGMGWPLEVEISNPDSAAAALSAQTVGTGPAVVGPP